MTLFQLASLDRAHGDLIAAGTQSASAASIEEQLIAAARMRKDA
jgi:hypothetical protein